MSTTFAITVADIINNAVLQQGWMDYQQTIDTTKQNQMLQVFQLMVKRFGAKGLKIWAVQELSFPFVANKRSYSLGPSGDVVTDRPLRLDYALIRPIAGGSDIPLNPLARQDYLMLGNKTQPGTPNSYFYDPQLTNGVVYFYLEPDAFNTGAYTPFLYPRIQMQDVSSVSANTLFPQEWYDLLVWGLAYETRLMNKVSSNMYNEIRETYMTFLKDAEDWDREYAPVEFGLDLSPGVYGNE